MIYVVSDIHGCYDKYKKMLQKLQLEPEDALFVLGDVIDKGEDGIKILADMRYRANIYPVLGEHEYIARKLLALLQQADTVDECEQLLSGEDRNLFDFWLETGGRPTLEGFLELSGEDRESILDYLGEFEPYEEIEAGGRKYILTHAGIRNFDENKPLEEYDEQDFISQPADPTRVYFKDSFLVTGHVPTFTFDGGDGKVYSKKHHLEIDCGAGEGGRLAVVCLDTLKVYYI